MEESDDDMDILENGLIIPTLIEQLKAILDQYPDNGQILKELLQNAEDAGARNVKFLLDETHFGELLGVDPEDKAYPLLGPALYCFNDAKLSGKDWEGLISVGKSIKQKDPTTVGKFGLGFKSVFHLTDLPSFYSGRGVGFIDPHEMHFLNSKGKITSSYPWKFSKETESCNANYLLQKIVYEFDLFDSVGKYDYGHSIFRFPIRQACSSSELSRDDYSIERVQNLLKSLQAEAYMNLLYMTNLEKVEIFHRKEVKVPAEKLFTVEISEESLVNIRRERNQLKNHISHISGLRKWNESPFSCLSHMNISLRTQNGQQETSCWLVCHYIDGGKIDTKLKSLFLDSGLELLPWVGVAAQMNRDLHKGHVFFSLPLPLMEKSLTGLPIHVHGQFCLERNRHLIKWPTAGQNFNTIVDKALLWNMGLVRETLPQAYFELLTGFKSLEKPDRLLSCLPRNSTEPEWHCLLEPLYLKIQTETVFYTYMSNQWVDAANSILVKEYEPVREVLLKVLASSNENVVDIPKDIVDTMYKVNPNVPFKVLSDDKLVEVLGERYILDILCPQEKINLLHYILRSGNYEKIDRIALLPLMNGKFEKFEKKTTNALYANTFNENLKELLPGTEEFFVDLNLFPKDHLDALLKSGHTQIRTFDEKAFVRLFIVSLKKHPHIARNKLLWEYLKKHFNSLDEFEGLKILPVTTDHGPDMWTLLKKQPQLVMDSANKIIMECLEQLGIHLALGIEPFAKQHGCIGQDYICFGEMEITKCLEYTNDYPLVEFEIMSTDICEQLRTFIHKITETEAKLTPKVVGLLEKLPIFRKLRDRSGSTCMVSVNKSEGACAEEPPVSVKNTILDLTEKADQILSQKLNISVQDMSTIILKYIIPTYTEMEESEREHFSLYVLQNIDKLLQQNADIAKDLGAISLVKNDCGDWTSVSTLFDTEDELIRELAPVDSIPSDTYKQYIEDLKKLGLKTQKTLQADDVVKFVSILQETVDEKKERKAKALIKLINQRPGLLNDEVNEVTLFDVLNDYAWIPVKLNETKYPKRLFWKGSDVHIAKPKDVLWHNDVNIYSAGSEVLIIDQSLIGISDNIKSIFNWERYPTVTMVVEHLKRMAQCYIKEEQMLHSLLMEYVYTVLSDNVLMLSKKHLEEISSAVWHGDGYTSCDRMLLKPPIEVLKPHFYKVPDILSTRQELLKKCNIVETCNLIDILTYIQHCHSTADYDKEEVERDRQIVIEVLQKTVKKGEITCQKNIFLPSNDPVRLSLIPLKYCTYHEKQWQQCISKEMLQLPEGIHLIHNDVPFEVAKKLHVPSYEKRLSEHAIDTHSEDIGDPFGQSEPLTLRIRNLLDNAYTSESDILKEFVQNADDAQATEIHFILDERNQSCEDEWLSLQGPALLVYNNAEFTEKDLFGIKQLGLGSKSMDPTKTGQYGIGFNCAYHMTDTPAFLTNVEERGEILVVFDPCLQNIRGANQENPGKIYRGELRGKYPNVFALFSCSQSNRRHGIFFRLPLRTKASEISTKTHSIASVNKILQSFQEEICKTMLFLQYVRKITISSIKAELNTTEEKYSAFLCLEKKKQKEKQRFLNNITEDSNMIKGKNIQYHDINRKETSFCLHMEDSLGLEQTWCVVESFGHHKDGIVEVKESILAESSNAELNLLPRGGVAALIFDNTSNQQGELQNVNEKKKCLYRCLPLPIETNLPVHVNGHFALDHESRQNLWNGKGWRRVWNHLLIQYVLAPSYARLLRELQDQMFEHPQRKRLRVTEHNKKEVHEKLKAYNKIFPGEMESEDHYEETLVKSVYQYLHDNHEAVMPVIWLSNKDNKILEWTAPTDAACKSSEIISLFTKEESKKKCRQSKQKKTLEQKKNLEHILVASGYKLFETTYFVRGAFAKYNVSLTESTPDHVLNFFKQYNVKGNSCHVKHVPVPLNQTCFQNSNEVALLLAYVKQMKGFVQKSLEGCPLLITADGYLRKYNSESIVYNTTFYDLFPEKSHQFLHPSLLRIFNDHPESKSIFKQFNLSILADMLPEKLPPVLNSQVRYLKWNHEEDQLGISTKWMVQFWDCVDQCCAANEEKMKKIQKTNSETNDNALDKKSCKEEFDKKAVYLETVAPLSSWNLLPGYSEDKNNVFLVPVGSPHLLIYPLDKNDWHQGKSETLLKEAFMSMRLPQLHIGIIEGRWPDITQIGCPDVTQLTSTEFTPMSLKTNIYAKVSVAYIHSESFLEALKNWEESMNHVIGDLTLAEKHISAVTDYFASDTETLGKKPEWTDIVKKLPIFKTIDKRYVRLINKQGVIIPKAVPLAGLRSLDNIPNFVFLQYPPDNHVPLLKILKCSFQTKVEIYHHFILPHMKLMPAKYVWQHIASLVEIWRENQRKRNDLYSDLLDSLKRIAFVPNARGELCCTKQFYDPHEPVFKIFDMLPPPVPPKTIHERDWLPFLRDTGINVTVKPNMILQYASLIEERARASNSEEVHNDLSQKCKTLLDNLFDNQQSTITLKKISQIEFIPLGAVSSHLTNIANQYGWHSDHLSFVSLIDGTLNLAYNEALVWTSVKILPTWVAPQHSTQFPSGEWRQEEQYFEMLKRTFRLQIGSVCMSKVVENIKCVCFELKHKLRKGTLSKKSVIEIFKAHFAYFQENIIAEELQKLEDKYFIFLPEYSSFVKPCQICMELDECDQIPPFLFRIPNAFGQYQDFFLKVGATQKPTAKEIQSVLFGIYTRYQQQQIDNPDDKEKAYQALFTLMILFKENKHDTLNGKLYVPSVAGFMIESNKTHYFDDVSVKARIQALNETLLDPFTVMAQIKSITRKNEWKLLNSNEREQIFEHFPENLRPTKLSLYFKVRCNLPPQIEPTQLVNGLNSRFMSVIFLLGLRRLLLASKDADEDRIASAIENIQKCSVASASRLQTHLEYKGNLVPQSEKDVICWLDVSASKLYCCDKLEMKPKLYTFLSRTLNKHLLHGLADELILATILQDDLQDIQETLDELGVAEIDTVEIEKVLRCGDFIPIADHHLLCQVPAILLPGDHVGYELTDDSVDGIGTTYIYARVIDEVTDKEKELTCKEYLIDVGNKQSERKSVLVLYKFFRNADPRYNERFKSIEEQKHTVTSILKTSVFKDEKEKKIIIRRLCLEWHPDRNIENIEFCEEMFKFIQSEIKRLKLKSSFEKLCSNIDKRAQAQRQFRQNYQDCPPTCPRKNPQPDEARRWMRQAQCDLQSAQMDRDRNTFFEWICFKSHQAAEKALKAARFAVDANLHSHDHNLRYMASGLEDEQLEDTAHEIECLLGGSTNMRYPDRLSFPKIPNDVYNADKAKQAYLLAEQIVQKCNEDFIDTEMY